MSFYQSQKAAPQIQSGFTASSNIKLVIFILSLTKKVHEADRNLLFRRYVKSKFTFDGNFFLMFLSHDLRTVHIMSRGFKFVQESHNIKTDNFLPRKQQKSLVGTTSYDWRILEEDTKMDMRQKLCFDVKLNDLLKWICTQFRNFVDAEFHCVAFFCC